MLVAVLPQLLPWGSVELLQGWVALCSGLERRLADLLLLADWIPSLLPQDFQTFLCSESRFCYEITNKLLTCTLCCKFPSEKQCSLLNR